MAVREAEYCLAAVKPYKLAWPVFYDFEYDSVDYAKRCGINATSALACDMALAFMQKVKAGGYVAGWYANPDYIRRYFTGAALNAYPLWIAQYASRYTYNGKAEVVIWQHSSSGKVAGVSGNCDMNHGYHDYRKQEVKPVAEPWYIKDGTWAKAKELGLMDGKRPTENITRAEVAAVAVRLYKLIKEGKA
jgi:GH25 family lysozyme M1 (1,4-beta-N-acetylmuramidase)